MMNEAQPSNLSFYWEVWFLPQRCCAKKMMYWSFLQICGVHFSFSEPVKLSY